MSSRERRLLDKDIEIRKLKGELKHYKTCFFSCVLEKERIRKALDIAVDALDRMAVNDSIYDIIARNAMKKIKELEQKD